MSVDVSLAFAGLMLTESDITDLVASRVYSDRVPQRSLMPCIVHRVISEVPFNALDGHIGMDQARIQVDAYSTNSRAEANDLAWKIWKNIETTTPQAISSVYVLDVIRDSGVRHAHDRVAAGSDEIRYRAIQDFLVSYHSCEVIS